MSHGAWQLCELVFRFLAIHPFQNGNGRLGRALFLLELLQSPEEWISYLAPYLAIDRYMEKYKAEYYLVLNRCFNGVYVNDPKKYKIEYFLFLDDITFYRNKHLSLRTLSESAVKVLESFKEYPEIRLNTKLIYEDTLLPRRTVINALNALLANDLIHKFGEGRKVRYQLRF